MTDYWTIVDGFAQRAKNKVPKFGDSYAIGALKATLVIALETIEDAQRAFEHKDPEEVVAHLRHAVADGQNLVEYIKEN